MRLNRLFLGIIAIIVIISIFYIFKGHLLNKRSELRDNLEALALEETIITYPCYMPDSAPSSQGEALYAYCLENTTELHIEDCAFGFVPRQREEECIFMIIYGAD